MDAARIRRRREPVTACTASMMPWGCSLKPMAAAAAKAPTRKYISPRAAKPVRAMSVSVARRAVGDAKARSAAVMSSPTCAVTRARLFANLFVLDTRSVDCAGTGFPSNGSPGSRAPVEKHLPPGADLAAVHRRRRGTSSGVAVTQIVIRHLLQLFLGHVQGQPVVVGLQVAWLHRDALPAHTEE